MCIPNTIVIDFTCMFILLLILKILFSFIEIVITYTIIIPTSKIIYCTTLQSWYRQEKTFVKLTHDTPKFVNPILA